jgi:hypothetical protein
MKLLLINDCPNALGESQLINIEQIESVFNFDNSLDIFGVRMTSGKFIPICGCDYNKLLKITVEGE